MTDATRRDEFDRLLSEFARQHNARSIGTWLTTLLVVLWPGAVAYARRSGDHAIAGKIGATFGALPR